jgi:2-polyprenyl-6-methoxyphenol hydroxylase-like FAD-dependent oxidoreductase
MAGLLASAVLARRFRSVTVIESDLDHDSSVPRKGTPQAAHIHLLLIRGAEAIETILPGIFDQVSAEGGLVADSTRDLAFFNSDAWQPRGLACLPARLQTRPLLEGLVARRVAQLPNVGFRYGKRAERPLMGEERVRGVVLRDGTSKDHEEIEADLVVDATGRATPTPRWMQALGLQPPITSSVEMKITYSSRFFHLPPSARGADWRAMLIYPRAPKQYRGGALYFQDGQRWIVTMASYRGERPPETDDEFLAFAKSLPSDEIYRLIRSAVPASPIATYSYPGALWRHYERLRHPLKRLVPIGDAVCSFNPVFGQGITTASLQALALGNCLDRGGLRNLEHRFARAAARICRTPWLLSTTMDLRYPHARASRPVWQPLVEAYVERYFLTMSRDYDAFADFMRVLHMVASPARLAKPRHLFAVLREAGRQVPPSPTQRPPLLEYTESGERSTS